MATDQQDLKDFEKATKSPKAIARQRRKESLRRTWAQYRTSKMGMFGLGILIFFVLVAIFAPLLASRCDLSPSAIPTPRRSRRPRASSGSARTVRAGRCSRSRSGARACR